MASHPLVDDVKKLAAFSTAIWQLEPHRKGLAPVAAGRGGPFNIDWEIHGDGPIKVVFICGLATLKSSYQRQTVHFGHNHGDRYSVLIMDNRGMGGSDKPLIRYKTSEMARDVVDVLDYVGWTDPRQVHVCGISMGGMISQELAYAIPGRLASLTLLSTAAKVESDEGLSFTQNLAARINMVWPRSLDDRMAYWTGRLFAPGFPDQPDNAIVPDVSSTLRVKPPSGGGPAYLKFQTNFERHVAQEIHKQEDTEAFTRKGFYLQLGASAGHHKTPAQLREIADKVGRDRILVVHGTLDRMISVGHGRRLVEHLQPASAHIIEGMGHAPVVEKYDWLAGVLEAHFANAEKLSGRAVV
ncbi:Alpha/Beta hydrolase protein [Xylariales sp. PMI_506]|nr:Alpha/Beta hydrolase protein [Xylariales sp. PMI_506]